MPRTDPTFIVTVCATTRQCRKKPLRSTWGDRRDEHLLTFYVEQSKEPLNQESGQDCTLLTMNEVCSQAWRGGWSACWFFSLSWPAAHSGAEVAMAAWREQVGAIWALKGAPMRDYDLHPRLDHGNRHRHTYRFRSGVHAKIRAKSTGGQTFIGARCEFRLPQGDVVETVTVKAPQNYAEPQLAIAFLQRVQSKTVNFTRFQHTSISREIWFGTRGSEVQILSPRPIISIVYTSFYPVEESNVDDFAAVQAFKFKKR